MIEFIPNPAFAEEMALEPTTHEAMRPLAEAALAAAAAASKSRQFRAALSVEEGEHGPVLVCGWHLWNIIEYGTSHNPPEAPLRKGVEAAGLTLTDRGVGGGA